VLIQGYLMSLQGLSASLGINVGAMLGCLVGYDERRTE
jgi:hypothetical protein